MTIDSRQMQPARLQFFVAHPLTVESQREARQANGNTVAVDPGRTVVARDGREEVEERGGEGRVAGDPGR